MPAAVFGGGVAGGGHRADRLRWSCHTSSRAEREPDDRREIAVRRAAGEGRGRRFFLRAVAEAVLQLLMEADVEGLIGAGRYERGGERTTWRRYHDIPATVAPHWEVTWISFKRPIRPVCTSL